LNELVIRTATPADAPALYALIASHQSEGHLLPRTIDDVREHAHHFVVCDVGGALKACAELAPLSARLAEVRSLVVAGDYRRVGVAARLVSELRVRAKASGFTSLCALTHDDPVNECRDAGWSRLLGVLLVAAAVVVAAAAVILLVRRRRRAA